VVLAASPNGSQILINDQIRGLFYLYSTSSGTSLTQGGLGTAAAWTPDSNTLYIVDSASAGTGHTNTLYVYNIDSGWSSYDLSSSGGAQNLAITVPGVGAYLAGPTTVAHTWCPTGTVGNNASIEFYPQSDALSIPNNILGATSDGKHMLGAELAGTTINLNDIGLSIPPSTQFPSARCPETITGTTQTLTALSTNPTINGTANLSTVTNASQVNQVVTGSAPTTASVNTAAPIAFVTYNPINTPPVIAELPYYLPQATGLGSVGYVTFGDSKSATPPTAPLAGAFSPDNSLFFVSTSGDNEIHFISIPTNLSPSVPPIENTQQFPPFSPNLPACTPVSAGGTDAGCLYPTAPPANTFVPATVVTVKPRSVT
jgi:hypothetical protein